MKDKILLGLLAHQAPSHVANLVKELCDKLPGYVILLIYGGDLANYDRIEYQPKVFVDDIRLRTSDHQRERQSYAGVMRALHRFIENSDFEFVTLMEWDCLPVKEDLPLAFWRRAVAQNADVLGFHVERVDRTNDPHWLSHAFDPGFDEWIAKFSIRKRSFDVVLSMLGAVSFWKCSVIKELVKIGDTDPPIYLEIFLPTVAHHCGFRVCDMGEQNRFVKHSGNFTDRIEEFREAGAWVVHPVK